MSRRMVIRCDECGTDADMRYPSWMSQTSFSTAPSGLLFEPKSMKPMAPEGWFERWAGPIRGERDFCSAVCVSAWDARQPKTPPAMA